MDEELGSMILHRCEICGRHFSLFENEMTYDIKQERYITCPYHGSHRKIRICGKYDNAKQCMEDARRYKRVRGSFRQLK